MVINSTVITADVGKVIIIRVILKYENKVSSDE